MITFIQHNIISIGLCQIEMNCVCFVLYITKKGGKGFAGSRVAGYGFAGSEFAGCGFRVTGVRVPRCLRLSKATGYNGIMLLNKTHFIANSKEFFRFT
jgi:hypothetical protein